MNQHMLFWLNGILQTESSEQQVAMAFTEVFGLGARIVLPMTYGRISFLDDSLRHMAAVINMFDRACPDVSFELEHWAHNIYLASRAHYLIELTMGIGGIDEPAKGPLLQLARLKEWNPVLLRLPSIRTVSSPWVRLSRSPMAGMSAISGLERAKLLSYARSQECDDGVWLNEDSYVVELGTASLLWRSNGGWVAPHPSLNATWSSAAEETYKILPIAWRKANADELLQSEGVFAISSTGTVCAVEFLDHREINVHYESLEMLEGVLSSLVFDKFE